MLYAIEHIDIHLYFSARCLILGLSLTATDVRHINFNCSFRKALPDCSCTVGLSYFSLSFLFLFLSLFLFLFSLVRNAQIYPTLGYLKTYRAVGQLANCSWVSLYLTSMANVYPYSINKKKRKKKNHT